MKPDAADAVRAWFDAVNAHDPDAIARTLTQDFTWTLWDATTQGRDASREAWRLLFEAFPDYHMGIVDMAVEGPKVVTRALDGGARWPHRREPRVLAPRADARAAGAGAAAMSP